jgi:hypothetical protein
MEYELERTMTRTAGWWKPIAVPGEKNEYFLVANWVRQWMIDLGIWDKQRWGGAHDTSRPREPLDRLEDGPFNANPATGTRWGYEMGNPWRVEQPEASRVHNIWRVMLDLMRRRYESWVIDGIDRPVYDGKHTVLRPIRPEEVERKAKDDLRAFWKANDLWQEWWPDDGPGPTDRWAHEFYQPYFLFFVGPSLDTTLAPTPSSQYDEYEDAVEDLSAFESEDGEPLPSIRERRQSDTTLRPNRLQRWRKRSWSWYDRRDQRRAERRGTPIPPRPSSSDLRLRALPRDDWLGRLLNRQRESRPSDATTPATTTATGPRRSKRLVAKAEVEAGAKAEAKARGRKRKRARRDDRNKDAS